MSLMYAQFGMAAMGAAADYSIQKSQYNIQAMTQEFSNKMRALTGSLAMDASRVNGIADRKAQMEGSLQIALQSMRDRASATAGAAAAGVKGSSVDAMDYGLGRSRDKAQSALVARGKAVADARHTDRRNLAIGMATGQDNSVLTRPSIGSTLLGLGASALDIYDQHQPEDQTSIGRLSKL